MATGRPAAGPPPSSAGGGQRGHGSVQLNNWDQQLEDVGVSLTSEPVSSNFH